MNTQQDFNVLAVSTITISQLADTTCVTKFGKLIMAETKYGGYAVFERDLNYCINAINAGDTIFYDDRQDLLFLAIFQYLQDNTTKEVDGQAHYDRLTGWLNGRLESLTGTYYQVNLSPAGWNSTKYSWGPETLTVANRFIDNIALTLPQKNQQAWAYINRHCSGWTKTRPNFLCLASLPDFFMALEDAEQYNLEDIADYELLTLTDQDGRKVEYALPVPYPSWYELFAELSHWAKPEIAQKFTLIAKDKSLLD